VIYVKGTTFWHGVRAFGEMTTTLCGRRLPSDSPIKDMVGATFLCRTCAQAIARSGLAA
jgi:hypothetical protein